MRNCISLLMLSFLVGCAQKPIAFTYEVECFSTGRPGEVSLKVWNVVSDAKDAEKLAPRNAVHAVLFKGVSGSDCTGLEQPLCKGCNAESDYFQEFFESGRYAEFVTLTNSGAIRAEDRLKTSQGYKIGMAVTVNLKLLRQRLEADGVMRKMDAGF